MRSAPERRSVTSRNKVALTMITRLSTSRSRASLLALSGIALLGCGRKASPPAAAAPTVLVTEVRQEDVPIYDDFVGTLDGSVNASVQARIAGYLTSQEYKEGSEVKRGDLLFRIDARPNQAAVAEANAAAAQAAAVARNAEMVAKRTEGLFSQDLISGQARDNAVQQAAADRANVEAKRAAAAQARLGLDYTAIRSPIDGIAGLATAQVGDLVGPSTGVLAIVSTVNPIKAIFTVSDQRYVAYANRWASDPVARAAHERQLEYELILADGSTYPHKGGLFAVDTQVDVRTGAQRIVTLFPNPGNVLRRGQFVRVRMRSEIRRGALLVPERAVIELQGSHQVVVVGADNKAQHRPVRAGRRVDRRWIIEAGLEPGERIVVEGLQKARDGVSVAPQPWAPAAPPPSPTPATTATSR